MKKTSICYVAVLMLLTACTQNQGGYQYPYKNPNLPIKERVADLLSRMTVTEKIKQLDMYKGKEVVNMDGHNAVSYSAEKTKESLDSTGVGSVHDFYPGSAEITNQVQHYAMEHTRLGIPVMFMEEGLHGYSGKEATCFPIPLELSGMWDSSLVHRIGHVIASEARSRGIDVLFTPVIGLARDPRWGRVQEDYGEDPYLDACNAIAMVKGLQGDTLTDDDAVVSLLKHFAFYNIPLAGSNGGPVSIGRRKARTFLYPFEQAIIIGGAKGVMVSYNDLDGIPNVDNKWLLTDVLGKEWGFKGFTLSDLGAIHNAITSFHVAKNTGDALSQAIKAGMDMQFYGFSHQVFDSSMKADLKNHTITEKELNNTVANILRVKFELGLFDHPYTDTALSAKVYNSAAHQALALKAAQEGIVLLKNEGHLLPLNKNVHSVAVIGPMAKSSYLGDYSGENPFRGISVLDGLRQRAGNTLKIEYAQGCNFSNDSTTAGKEMILLRDAIATTKRCDVSVVILGENIVMDGEGKDRANLNLRQHQQRLIRALYQTGKPIVVVLLNGRPLTINWIAQHIPSIVEGWYSGEKGGLAIADVLLGNVDPSGRLPITFPRSVGQIPYFYDHMPTATHRYVDEKSTPLFPFGFGLSYTSFQYSNMQVSPEKITDTGSVKVSLNIKNTGKVTGTAVVELYIRDMISSVTTPVEALKGFHRITLNPGESGRVTFKLTPQDLSLWNRQMKKVVEPGEFKIMIGSSSADIRQTGNFWVVKN